MTDKSVFNTETAAKILESQGYRAKAAEVYLRLSLSNPGKAVYYRTKFESLQSDLIWVEKNHKLIDLFYLWITNITEGNRLDSLRKTRIRLIEQKKYEHKKNNH